ncbi:Zinc finger, BED-type [Sesbania bispinosa]|nr:Zinc finger, BED-type [Sesbania bispinosa]
MAKRKAIKIASEAASSGPNPNQQVDHGDVPAPLQVNEVTETQGPTQTQQVPTPAQQEAFKRKPSRPPSNAWTHFTKENDKATCNYCKKQYACNVASHVASNV